MIRSLSVVLALIAAPVVAQQVDWATLGEALRDTRPAGPEMSSGTEAVLRGLDKVSGALEDLTVAVGGVARYGRLQVQVSACRFPTENPSSDAFVFLRITDTQRDEVQFQGWMIASSPALSALDHPRYDIWVLGCR